MIHELLKKQTQHFHVRLEERLNLFERISGLGPYQELLEKFFLFYQPLEEVLAQYGDWELFELDYQNRRKTDLLRKDLLALDPSSKVLTNPRGAPRSALPRVDVFERAVGCLYVLEGSTLGGQIISKRLGPQLGVTPETGLAFYSAYGTDVGKMWRSFCVFLEDFTAPGASIPEVDLDAIVAGACDTFEKLESWLCASPAEIHPA